MADFQYGQSEDLRIESFIANYHAQEMEKPNKPSISLPLDYE